MTEEEWLACADPESLEVFLSVQGEALERKWRLLACACCRRIWSLLADERSRQGVEATERYADGEITVEQLREFGNGAYDAFEETDPRDDEDEDDRRFDPHPGHAVWVAANAIVRLTSTGDYWQHGFEAAAAEVRRAVWFASQDQQAAVEREKAVQCALVRDLFGNPFRPVSVDPAWRTATVTGLARAAYQGRILPGGELEAQRLLVLADALEEAGCTEVILGHLRGPGPHTRGCWALDTLVAPD